MKKIFYLLTLLTFFQPHLSDGQNGVISLFAGGGTGGDGSPATSAQLSAPVGLAIDAYGNVYIADKGHYKIRKVDTAGIITTFAGDGTEGSGGDGGPATAAQLDSIGGICFGGSNLYVACGNRIRMIEGGSGIISDIVSGIDGYGGDGGPASAAKISGAYWIASHDILGLFISDANNNRIRRIDHSGNISTVIGTGVAGFNGDGLLADSTQINHPEGLCLYNGFPYRIYFADAGNNRVRWFHGSGAGDVTTITGNGITGFSGDGHPSVTAEIDYPTMVYIDNNWNIYFSDFNNHRIRYIKSDGVHNDIMTIAGNGTIGAGYSGYAFVSPLIPFAIASNPATGDIYVADSLSQVFKITMPSIFSDFYIDNNNNCVLDSSDSKFFPSLSVIVDSDNITIDTLSVTNGMFYYANGNGGDIYKFSVSSISSNLITTCPASGVFYDTIQYAPGSAIMKDIGFQCDTIAGFDFDINTLILRSGVHTQQGRLYISNKKCSPTDATVSIYVNDNYHFNGSVPSPSAIAGNMISWNLPALSNATFPLEIEFWLEASTHFAIGDVVKDSVIISPIIGDLAPANNSLIVIDTVVSGFDPNEMIVSPTGCIGAGTKLTYTIGFENTGNDTAFNIYVIDSLDNSIFDPASFRLITASVVMNTARIYSGGYSIIKFDFPNINLLDSSHHGLCDGMIQYTINTRPGIPDGVSAFNHAGIYFDSNPVVMTNTTQNKIGCPASVAEVAPKTSSIKIYPNPATESITITSGDKIEQVAIINLLGQTVYSSDHTLHGNTEHVSVANLPNGVYFVKVNGTEVKKFIKEQ